MGQLTLIAAPLAKEGFRFTFRGDASDEACQECPVRALCFRLQVGHHYEVTEVRDVRHACGLHDGDQTAVCIVEEVPIETSLESKHLRGSAAHWTPVPCGYAECDHYAFCHPAGPTAGAKYEIVTVGTSIDCPMRYDIKRVTLRPLE